MQELNLKSHIDGRKKHSECEFCGKSFTHPRNHKNHIHTVHQGHKDYKCETCGKSFSRAEHLKKHIHAVHEGHKDNK